MLLVIGLILIALVAAILSWVFWGQHAPPEEDDVPPPPVDKAAIFALVALAASGCANQYTVAHKVLGSAATVEIAAGRQWMRADAAHERRLLDEAKAAAAGLDDAGRAAIGAKLDGDLKAWRAKSDTVNHSLDALAEATIAAHASLVAYEASKGKFSLTAWIKPLLHAGLAVEAALRAAGVPLPSFDEFMAIVRRFLEGPPPSQPVSAVVREEGLYAN